MWGHGVGINDRATDELGDGMSQRASAMKQQIGRRTVVSGAAWAVPVIAMAATAPAVAASPNTLSGCYSVPLTNTTRTGTQGTNGTLSGAGTGGDAGAMALAYTIGQNRTSGLAQGPGPGTGAAVPDPTHGDFSVQTGSNLGAGVYMYGSSTDWHWGGTTNTPLVTKGSGSFLVLNQATKRGTTASQLPSETVTFSFGTTAQIPTSVTFTIYDITRVDSPSNAYTDVVTLNQTATVTGFGAGTYAAGTPILGTAPSATSGTATTVTMKPTSSSFTLTYSSNNTTGGTTQNVDYMGSQYIAIGNMTVCY